MLESSWVAAQLAASQEGLSSMKLFSVQGSRLAMSEVPLLCSITLMKEAELIGETCLFEDSKEQ
jgi:hypothetical protein